jgi:hypothetical protein
MQLRICSGRNVFRTMGYRAAISKVVDLVLRLPIVQENVRLPFTLIKLSRTARLD